MLGLLKSTEVGKIIPKEKFVQNLTLSPKQKETLTRDIKRIRIANELSQKSMNIKMGAEVRCIFVMEIELKEQSFDEKFIAQTAKQNPNKILFHITNGEKSKLAVFYHKLYQTDWQTTKEITLQLKGETFDEVWDNLVRNIANITTEQNQANNPNPKLQDQLETKETIARLKKEIEKLQDKIKKETQPKKKFELNEKLAQLVREMDERE